MLINTRWKLTTRRVGQSDGSLVFGSDRPGGGGPSPYDAGALRGLRLDPPPPGMAACVMATVLVMVLAAAAADGSATHAAALSTPAPPPLIPQWAPTYDLQRSLVAMPCNESGYSDGAKFSQIGIVTFDMNNAHDVWEATAPSSPEEVLERQCAMTKKHSKDVKCGVYRNSGAPPPRACPRAGCRRGPSVA